MQKLLHLKVKFRESFRLFAPAVLREDVAQWFDLDGDSPYMLLVAAVKRERQRPMSAAEQRLFGIDKLNVVRSEIPAVTHVDHSARVQTVHQETNPRFHALLSAFNVRGEPIVCTPEDAFRCFMGTDIEMLALGDCLLRKEKQSPGLKRDYKGCLRARRAAATAALGPSRAGPMGRRWKTGRSSHSLSDGLLQQEHGWPHRRSEHRLEGRGLWTTFGSRTVFHGEGGKEARLRVFKLQMHPDPLAH